MREETLDKLIRQSFDEIAEQEFRELGHIETHTFSRPFRKKMKRLLKYGKRDRSCRNDRQEAGRSGGYSIPFNKRMVVVLVALIVMLVGVMVVGARESVTWLSDHSFTYKDGFMEIERVERTHYIIPKEFEKAELTYVPRGYKLDGEDMSKTFLEYSAVYMNKEGEALHFMQMGAGKIKFDLASNGEPMEKIYVNGYAGYFIPANHGYSVLFCDEKCMYVIMGNLTREELMKMARGIRVPEENEKKGLKFRKIFI